MSVALLGAIARHGMEGLARTWNLTVDGDDAVRRARADGQRIAFAVWHGMLLVPLWHRRHEGITLLISQHGDAQHLADAGRHWGYGIVRGSSTRGAVGGMRGVLRAFQLGRDIATTPDGPRGPARVAKPGLAWAAAHTRASIVPVGVATTSAWALSSWDRFNIPRPGARVHLHYGEPIQLDPVQKAEAAGVLRCVLNDAERVARCKL